ncbi:hypothetical protein [Alkaliphilus hydrothermalis]|uniref:Stage 0 sporulation protein A homolog n=1 Tax=Alkaliphilus hydrothermalis TaxID=1482730 RepID=A0ABS2NTY9_9FIRM|nr:hypothetical protein [Alkaliphilus hydrothermalis]MBM7616408.1 DNA-binding response OmpR family regulator [Alkaliphilus hydrothermalis]
MKDKKILVVDDEPELLRMIEKIFKKEGFKKYIPQHPVVRQ